MLKDWPKVLLIHDKAKQVRDISMVRAKYCMEYVETKVQKSKMSRLVQSRVFKYVVLGLLAYFSYCKLWNFYYDRILK